MDPARVLELCHEHAGAEAEQDFDRVLATLCPNPQFEFYPLGMGIGGWDNVETFYREQYGKFAKGVVGYEVIGEWTNEVAAAQEYVIDWTDGETTHRFRVMSMMPGDEASGLLSGERVYASEEFVRALLGPLYDHLRPLD